VAARGLDINDVSVIINFDPAKNLDLHVHRVGRAGRMSREDGEYREGLAYTLLAEENCDFASLLVESFEREGRIVEEGLLRLARRSRYFGRSGSAGGAGKKRSFHGVGWNK